MTVPGRAARGPAWLLCFIRLVLRKGDAVPHSTMLAAVKERADRRRLAGQHREAG